MIIPYGSTTNYENSIYLCSSSELGNAITWMTQQSCKRTDMTGQHETTGKQDNDDITNSYITNSYITNKVGMTVTY